MARGKLSRGLLDRTGRRLRYFYLRLILLPDTPRRVALGFAIGMFIGLLPIIPFQTVTSVALAWLLGGSKVAAPIGALITNPLTIPFFYSVFYYIGRLLTPFGHKGGLPADWTLSMLTEIGVDTFLAAMAGGFVMAIVLAPLTYWLTLNYIGRLQAWERRKLRERFDISPSVTG